MVKSSVVKLFRKIDKDKAGVVDALQLQEAIFDAFNVRFNIDTVFVLLDMLNSRNEGVDASKFRILWDYLGKWKESFLTIDNENSGKLDYGQLLRAIKLYGIHFSENIAHIVLKKFDMKRNNGVLFDDYIRIMVIIKSANDAFNEHLASMGVECIPGVKQNINLNEFIRLCMKVSQLVLPTDMTDL